jgi:hypothetical protein
VEEEFSSAVETGTLHLFKNDGSPLILQQVNGPLASSFPYDISANGVYIFQTDGSPAGINTGSVQLIPDPGISTPVGAGIFRLTQGGIVISESGVPASTPTTHARIFLSGN